MDVTFRKKILPFLLTAVILIADQVSKEYIVKHWPQNVRIYDVFSNGFLEIWHVRNKAIAFSLGRNIPEMLKPALFIIIPFLVLVLLFVYFWKTSDLTRVQRWAVAGIIGGGLGNIIDRVFRPDGVVDFVSIKFYGLLGMDRWPTFNIADASVVVSCFILIVTMLTAKKTESEAAR
ncbi:MAG: signal peptidase II [Treponema sp.]|jgi:signal peptidase II|nr:signal peptidase II [Treponema sp.]